MIKKVLITLVSILLLLLFFAGCEQSDRVSQNLSKEADSFNIVRQVTVINGITGDVNFQMTGRLSIEVTQIGLEVVVEYEKGQYAKHMFIMGDNDSASVEQLGYAEVNNYQYSLNFNPKMWLPVVPKYID